MYSVRPGRAYLLSCPSPICLTDLAKQNDGPNTEVYPICRVKDTFFTRMFQVESLELSP
jgi:hypothetical protein